MMPNNRLRFPSGRYSSLGRNVQAAVLAPTVIAATIMIETNLLRLTSVENPVNPRTNNPASQSIIGRRMRFAESCPLPPPMEKTNRESAGMTVMETSSDSVTATEIATAISRNNWPASSCMVRIGTNTKTVVNTDTSTAPQTCCAPT